MVGFQLVQQRHHARDRNGLVSVPASRFLLRRFGTLSSVAGAASTGLIPLFIALSSTSRAWAVAFVFTYTLAVSVLVLMLAISYLSTQEWHYLWRSAMIQVGAPVPGPAAHHGRFAFLAERALGVSCIFCAGLGLIGVVAGVGAVAWPAAVVGSAAFVAMFTAMMRDMTDSIRNQFRRRRE
jgi:hypothetical protein